MVTEVGFQVVDEQNRFAGRGYDDNVIRLEGQLDLLRGVGLFCQ